MELFLISGVCVLVGFIAGAFFMHHYLHPGETLVQAATEVEAAVVAEALVIEAEVANLPAEVEDLPVEVFAKLEAVPGEVVAAVEAVPSEVFAEVSKPVSTAITECGNVVISVAVTGEADVEAIKAAILKAYGKVQPVA